MNKDRRHMPLKYFDIQQYRRHMPLKHFDIQQVSSTAKITQRILVVTI